MRADAAVLIRHVSIGHTRSAAQPSAWRTAPRWTASKRRSSGQWSPRTLPTYLPYRSSWPDGTA